MDYSHITLFLHKFKKILFKKEELLAVLAGLLEKHIHSPVDIKNLSIRGSTLYINMSPLFRNEVLIKKESILKDIESLSLEYSIKDIR